MDLSQCEWNDLKNKRLKKTRGVSFEEILNAKLIGIEDHPSKAWQKTMIFEWENYVWIVPFVKSGERVFLKTIYPSRKHKRRFQKGGKST